MLSSAAFLAHGLLVFGRPLSTRQEGGGITLPYSVASTPLFSPNSLYPSSANREDPINFAPTSPGDVQQNAYPKAAFSGLDTSSVSSLKVPNSDAYLTKLAFSSQLGPDTSLKTDLSNANLPGTYNPGYTSVQKQPETFGTTLNPITPPSMVPSQEIAPSTPENFEENLTKMKAQYGGYCYYELSQGDEKLVLKKCAHDGKFKQVYEAASTGVGFYYHYYALFIFCKPGDVHTRLL